MHAAGRHRLGAEAVGLPQDHCHEGDAEPRGGHEQPRTVADEPGRLRLRPDHHPRRVDQRDQRQAEGVAKLHETGGLVGGVAVDGARKMHRVVGDDPERPPVDPHERRHHRRAEALAEEGGRALVGERLDHRVDVIGAAAALGHQLAQPGLVVGGSRFQRALEVGEKSLRHRDGLGLVGDADVDHPVAGLGLEGADVVGVDRAEPAPLDHRRAAHPQRDALGGHDQVRGAGDDGVAREAAPRDDRDPGHDAREARPEREGAGLERRDDGVVGVPGAPSPALGEEHRRQLHALDQLEQAVLLLVADRALGAGEDRVVVGEDRAGGAVAELLGIDGADPRDQAVGGRALEQLAELAAPPLGRDREPAVLDEAAGVDQVGEVLARRSRAGGVAALNRLGAGGVLGLRPALERFPQVRSRPLGALFGRFPARHGPSVADPDQYGRLRRRRVLGWRGPSGTGLSHSSSACSIAACSTRG